MATSTAQTAAAAPIAEPTFLLSGTASECLAQLAERFPRLNFHLGGWIRGKETIPPIKVPPTLAYDFRNPRPLSEVLARLQSDLKQPHLAAPVRLWRELCAMPSAPRLTAADWCDVLGGRAQLATPRRFALHGHAVESWSSPWVQDERAAPFWGPAKCCACANSVSGMFYNAHHDDCEPQCSGLDGRCGSPLCNGCCVGCVRGNSDCWGSCGAGGPCEAFTDGEPLRGGPCVEGEGAQDEQPDDEDDRQDAPAEQPIALAEPPAPAPTKPAYKPVEQPKPAKQTATDDKDAKRLASPATVKPPAKRKPLDVAGALAALAK